MKSIKAFYLIITMILVSSSAYVLSRTFIADGTGRHGRNGLRAGLHTADRQFRNRCGRRMDNVSQQSEFLAGLLQDKDATDQEIIDRSEKIIAQRSELLRSVAANIVELRSSLDPADRDQLMQICSKASAIDYDKIGRGLQGQGKGLGRGNGPSSGQGRRGSGERGGQFHGGGNGRAMQSGKGRGGSGCGSHDQQPEVDGHGGHGNRGCGSGNCFGRRLGLTDQQHSQIEKADPDYQQQNRKLLDELLAQQESLKKLFDDPKSADDQIKTQAELLIKARENLERRLIKHVIAMRPILTDQQRKALSGFCGGRGCNCD